MHLLDLGGDLFMHFIINTYGSLEISLSASQGRNHIFYWVGSRQRKEVYLNDQGVSLWGCKYSFSGYSHIICCLLLPSNPYLRFQLNHPSLKSQFWWLTIFFFLPTPISLSLKKRNKTKRKSLEVFFQVSVVSLSLTKQPNRPHMGFSMWLGVKHFFWPCFQLN